MLAPQVSLPRAGYPRNTCVHLDYGEEDRQDWLEGSKAGFKPSCQIATCNFVPRVPNPEAAWTTARCNRLIRPISSKIAGLRRLKKTGSRELQTVHPDSRGVLSAEAVRRSKPPCSRVIKGSGPFYNAHPNLTSPCSCWLNEIPLDDGNDSSSTDSGHDPWSDVSREGRARKRLKRTYLNRRSTQAPAAPIYQSNLQTVLLHPVVVKHGSAESYTDALALSGNGVPDVSVLEQRGNSMSLRVNADLDKINIDSILPGDFRSCTRRLCREFRELAKSLLPVTWRLIDGIWENLEALLRATSEQQTRKKDPQSLLETCLKQLPTYIIKEQTQVSTEDPDDKSNVARTIYDEFEALGTSSEAGWRPLKEVARAHGIRLLADAVEECLISLPLARGLVILCLHREAYKEAQVIVESMLRMMKPLPKPRSINNKIFAFGQSISLHTMALIHGTNSSDNLAFTYRQLATLFRRRVLPIEWIACRDLVDLWNRIVISITQTASDAPEAATLLRVIVGMMYGDLHDIDEEIDLMRSGNTRLEEQEVSNGQPRSSLELDTDGFCSTRDMLSSGLEAIQLRPRASKTIANILTVLSAIAILQNPEQTILQDISVEAQKAQEFSTRTSARKNPMQADKNQLGLVILAFDLVQAYNHRNLSKPLRTGFARVDGYQLANAGFFALAGSFVCSVARCCGKAVAKDPFLYLQNLLEGLDRLSSGESRATRKLREGISVAAAFKFAEETNQSQHLQWALELEQRATSGMAEQTLRTPGRKSGSGGQRNKSGYRWEEGICEWVAKTPAGTLRGLEQNGLGDAEADDNDGINAVAEDALLLRGSGGLTRLFPCSAERNRRSKRHQEAAYDNAREQEITSSEEEGMDNDGSKKRTIRRKRVNSDIENHYNEEADELSISPNPASSESSQAFASMRSELDTAAFPYIGQSPRRSQRPPPSKRLRLVRRSTLLAVADHATNKMTKAEARLEASEDELSFS